MSCGNGLESCDVPVLQCSPDPILSECRSLAVGNVLAVSVSECVYVEHITNQVLHNPPLSSYVCASERVGVLYDRHGLCCSPVSTVVVFEIGRNEELYVG